MSEELEDTQQEIANRLRLIADEIDRGETMASSVQVSTKGELVMKFVRLDAHKAGESR